MGGGGGIKTVSPNLNQEHHYIFGFPEAWIKKAKQIRKAENNIQGKNKVYSAYRWSGKLGEWGFYTLYQGMKPVTSNYHAEDKDFVSEFTSYKYDTKVKNSAEGFKEYYHADLNEEQYLKGKDNVDIYVFVSYMLGTSYLRFCGWLYYNQIKERGILWKKGKVFKGHKVKADKYSIDYAELNSMHLLEEVVGEKLGIAS